LIIPHLKACASYGMRESARYCRPPCNIFCSETGRAKESICASTIDLVGVCAPIWAPRLE
jgi:hypothetical protein